MISDKKGKILRVKTGYNPNSSSIGSQIPVFLFTALGTGILAVLVVQTVNMIENIIKKRKESLPKKNETAA